MVNLHQNNRPHSALINLFSVLGIPTNGSFSHLVMEAQKQLLRPKNKERWEIDPLLFAEKREQLLPLLTELDCVNAIPPSPGHYHYLIIFGFVTIDVKEHLNYIAPFLNNGTLTCDQAVILTSSLPIAPLFKSRHTTEAELMVDAYQTSPLSSLPYTLINVPMHATKRPTTQDTINGWLATAPTPGRALALSGQPFIRRQTSILQTLVPTTFTITPSGPAAEPDLAMGIYLDELARALYQEAGASLHISTSLNMSDKVKP
jgi:hypothetical protein